MTDGVPAGPTETVVETLSRIEQEILRAVRTVRYGSVEIVIHDSQVVQVERREKVRLDGQGARRVR